MTAIRNTGDPPGVDSDWEAAIAYGVDVSLLEANLQLTVEARIEQLHRQTQLFELLRPGQSTSAPADHAGHT